ncbi:hypothetical protein J132_10161 [Termitomyces sp. J132]|nr:hypothetical protein C0989_005975 [Termitomyces sp. Mn162]KAH0585149.1 hypothetical protein H2248_008407 [Termitomyces sp. 'cryptogamus']KNZ81883.1 hypothetical protein J132_10161 [Termitomyces sp. J132]
MAAVSFQDEQPNILRSTKIFGYRERRRGWRHMSARKYEEQLDHPSSIQIVTWNLDHRAPYPKERMFMALRHLETYVFKCGEGQDPVACCIMLQEVHEDALPHLLDDAWIRKHFVVTPITANKWPHGYGNVTLVARTVVVVFAGTLSFGYSSAGRGALIVDLKVSSPKANEPQEMVLRMINTHLEPGALRVRMRRIQLGVLTSLLRKTEHVRGGVIVGGMNAVSPDDAELPSLHNLLDAWVFPDKNPSGITWGLQDSGELPPARLDKVLYVDRRKAYTIDSPKRIGMGLRAFDNDRGSVGWVSDHYGLLTRLLVRAR